MAGAVAFSILIACQLAASAHADPACTAPEASYNVFEFDSGQALASCENSPAAAAPHNHPLPAWTTRPERVNAEPTYTGTTQGTPSIRSPPQLS